MDLDDVCLSNVNRQLPALDGTIGPAQGRSYCRTGARFTPGARYPGAGVLTADTVERLLAPPVEGPPWSGVLDAIDRVVNKCVLIHGCRRTRNPGGQLLSAQRAGEGMPPGSGIEDLAR